MYCFEDAGHQSHSFNSDSNNKDDLTLQDLECLNKIQMKSMLNGQRGNVESSSGENQMIKDNLFNNLGVNFKKSNKNAQMISGIDMN